MHYFPTSIHPTMIDTRIFIASRPDAQISDPRLHQVPRLGWSNLKSDARMIVSRSNPRMIRSQI